MNENIIQFALIEYIKSLKNIDSPLRFEAIQEFININEKCKKENKSYYIDVFKTMGLSEIEKKNYYSQKGR